MLVGAFFLACVVPLTDAAATRSAIDEADDSRQFCPPLAADCDKTCGPRVDYDKLIRFHAQVLRWLWLADIHSREGTNGGASCSADGKQQSQPSEWEALANLAETAERLDCTISWWQCFPSVGGAIDQFRDLCDTFRNRARLAAAPLGAEDESFIPQMLSSHLCFKDTGYPVSEDGYRTLLVHEHIRKLGSGRAVRMLQLEPKPLKVGKALPRWTYPAAHLDEDYCPSCDAHIPAGSPPAWWAAPTIAEMLEKAGNNRRGLFINLGAREGACEPPGELQYLPGGEVQDPANCLAAAGYGGIVVEGDDRQFTNLRQLYGERMDIELLLGWVDPGGVRESIPAAVRRLGGASADSRGVEDLVDFLKVDVDNCDCCFVEELLAGGLRPRLIHAEIHSLIPPPIAFRPRLRQDFSETSLSVKEGAAHLHCSLAAYEALLGPYGYQLSHLVSRDAIFARGDVAKTFPWIRAGTDSELTWKHGYRCHPHWRTKHEEPEYTSVFRYDFRRWTDTQLSAEERLRNIQAQLDCSGLRDYQLWVYSSGSKKP